MAAGRTPWRMPWKTSKSKWDAERGCRNRKGGAAMKVFEVKPDFAYLTIYTSNPNGPEDVEEENSLDGKAKLATWKPLPMFEADGASQNRPSVEVIFPN